MLIACWSVKGGSGTTVVAASLAVVLARSTAGGVLAVDLAGDLPAALGLPEPSGPGLVEWAATPDSTADALSRLEAEVRPGLTLIPAGVGRLDAAGAERLCATLAGERQIVVDCGSGGDAAGLTVAASAALSLLILRPCYLALRRALAAPLRPSGVILVNEPGRSLGRHDIEDVLGVPVGRRSTGTRPSPDRSTPACWEPGSPVPSNGPSGERHDHDHEPGAGEPRRSGSGQTAG